MIVRELVGFAAQYGIVQNTLLKELTVPYAILMDDGKLVWMNDAFEKVLKDTKIKKRSYLSQYVPELNRGIFPKEEDQTVEMEVYHNDREYLAEIRKVSVDGINDEDALVQILTEPKNALLKQYKKLFEYDDIELDVEHDALVEIAKKAISQKTGARGLRAIIENVLMQPMFEAPSNPDIKGITITAASINGDEKPRFIMRHNRNRSEQTA